MQLFYNSNITELCKEFSFDKEESKHIIKVLRKKEADEIQVTNGKGNLFYTQIILATEKKCTVKIVSVTTVNPTDYYIHIAVAPTKMNERFEWFLEKATEMGIHEITPIICDRSERKTINLERYAKIILTAMKQSLHLFEPKLNPPISFKEFVSKNQEGSLYIAHCEELEKTSFKTAIKPKEKYTVLIGPEGDFSNTEIQLALANNYQPISLGNTRLRTETAAIVACHSLVFNNE